MTVRSEKGPGVKTLHLSVLRMLRRSAEPLSGRQVAEIAGVAPNTAINALKQLERDGLVMSRRKGSANVWSTTVAVAELDEFSDRSPERVALVVTALELEHVEVRQRLVNVERVRIAGTWMLKGLIIGTHLEWTVYVARAGMGNATAAALVGLAAGELGADVVGFVGIAAGLKPGDQHLRDVVVADRIHNPYIGKQVASEDGSMLLGRDNSYRVAARLISTVRACISDSSWTTAQRHPQYESSAPHATIAAVVAVDAVQSDLNGPVLGEVRARYQDAGALDMESYGLAAGADLHDVPVLVVRGISDFIGNKTEPGNDAVQPDAASNAARLFKEILTFAHPDDFKSATATAPGNGGEPDDSSSERGLPASARIWLERLRQRAPSRATSAERTVRQHASSGLGVSTWFGQALHRPPEWLREDVTGDGWAFVSSLASIAESRVAWRGYLNASELARGSGDRAASEFFALCAWLGQLAADSRDAEDPEPIAEPTGQFVLVAEFFRSVSAQNLRATMVLAAKALESLGLEDKSGVLPPGSSSELISDVEPVFRDLVGSMVLRQVARLMLAPGAADDLGVQSGLAARTLRGNPVTRDLADDGLRLANWALQLTPDGEGTRLTHAQVMLGALVSMTGRTARDVRDEVSERARTIEINALGVRDAYREWGGPAGSALAVAARARSVQGDYEGALRLLRPPPDGLATASEAKHPEVVRLGAFLARAAGNDELALDLAQKNPDRVEGELMRAAVLSGRREMAAEARAALMAALELSSGAHHNDFQALMALCRQFADLDDHSQSVVRAHVAKLGELDDDLAEVMRARIALSLNEPGRALRHVRGLEQNELALEAQAEALAKLDRAHEAVELVFREGIRRGDVALATEALELAMSNGLIDDAERVANELMSRRDAGHVHLRCIRALRHIGHARGDWQEVARRTRQVIESLSSEELPVPEVEAWRLIESLYYSEEYDQALDVFRNTPAVGFEQREKALLFLSVLMRVGDEQRINAGSDSRGESPLKESRLYELFMRAASDWADDEQVAASALAVVLTAPDAGLSDLQVADFRRYANDYFERYGPEASIKQIEIEGEDLEPLFEVLRSDRTRTEALTEIAEQVRTGRLPLAILAQVAGRSYAESLVRQDIGTLVAIGGDHEEGLETARLAADTKVVVDTSALVVAGLSGHQFRKLSASFDSVTVPTALKNDVARARSSLAMRSTSTIGWDPIDERPVVTEISVDTASSYADSADLLWSEIRPLRALTARASDDHEWDGEVWFSAIALARELGAPMWADDVALRTVARSLGVRSFGTLDLIRADMEARDVADAIGALQLNMVSDIPLGSNWFKAIDGAGFDVNSYAGLAVSRAASWTNTAESFRQFRAVMLGRPADLSAEATSQWLFAFASGLARSTATHLRPQAVSSLLVWGLINLDPFFYGNESSGEDGTPSLGPGDMARHIFAMADELATRFYPHADALKAITHVLRDALSNTVGPEVTSQIFASFVSKLEPDLRRRVFSIYVAGSET